MSWAMIGAAAVTTGGTYALNRWGGGGGGYSGPNISDFLELLNQYTYQPQYTGQTETGLFDLFETLTGRRGGPETIPFDIGLPTSGLYDALTRGIKEDFLGTPGGPEGGRIADIRAYYNNLGIPEYAINQERLANKDLNNILTDVAATLNESLKNRLFNVLSLGSNIGQNLYGQNLAQHRFNAGAALNAAGLGLGAQDAIRQANQSSLNDLFGGAGAFGGNFLTGLLSSLGGGQSGTGTAPTTGLNSLLTQQTPPGFYYPGVPGLSGRSTANLFGR